VKIITDGLPPLSGCFPFVDDAARLSASLLPASVFILPLDKKLNPGKIQFDIYLINSTEVNYEELP
jgi:hypothetical protein